MDWGVMMSRRNRRNKPEIPDVPGGIRGAIDRWKNGAATNPDVDFLLRLRREAVGLDGYTGGPKGEGSLFTESHSYGSPFPGASPRRDPYEFTTHHTPPKDNEVFHCKEAGEVTGKCPLNPVVPSILMDAQMWDCFIKCTREYDTEWIALLIGSIGQDSNGVPAYIITKFYFPPQTASGAHVDVPTGVVPKPNTIGAIHSHVGMGVFWSETDKAHSNWPVEIVVNRKEEYKALSRYQLKCGEWAKSDSVVYLTGSSLNKGIRGEVDKAFSEGARLEAAAKGGAVVMPSTIHPDDVEDVAEALINPSSNIPLKELKEEAAKLINQSLKDEFCGMEGCVRENNHPGFHKTKDNYYFQMGSEVDEKEKKGEQQGIVWPPANLLTDKATVNQDSEPDLDPLDPTDATEEESCPLCQGVTLVEAEEGGNVITCPKCRGDGMSEVGRQRALLEGYNQGWMV